MSVESHITEHAELKFISAWGKSGVSTVGPGARHNSLQKAIDAILFADLVKVRTTQTHVITATNASRTVTGVSTLWQTGGTRDVRLRPGDLWKPDATSQYYKIYEVVSDTEITLHETFKDTTITATSTAYSSYYLNRHTIIHAGNTDMNDGAFAGAVAASIDLTGKPGIDIISLAGQTGTEVVAGGLSDNRLTGFRFRPVDGWCSTDALFDVDADAWAGSELIFNNCDCYMGDTGGCHQGGNPGLPVIRGGLVRFESCKFNIGYYLGTILGGSATDATIAETQVEFYNPICRPVLNWNNAAGIKLVFFDLQTQATYTFNNPDILIPDLGRVGGADEIVGINLNGTNSVLNINGGRVHVLETSDLAVGVATGGVGTTSNLHNVDIEATDYGYFQSSTGTSNIRHCRVKGGTNSINEAAGTLNYDNATTLIGAVGGTPVLVDT